MKIVTTIATLIISICTLGAHDSNNMLWSKNIEGKAVCFNDQMMLFKISKGLKPLGYRLINLESGADVWQENNDLSRTISYSDNVFSFRDNVIIQDTKNNTLNCYNLISGNLLWRSNELLGYQLKLIPKTKMAIGVYYSYSKNKTNPDFYTIDLQTGSIVNKVTPNIPLEYTYIFVYAVNKDCLLFNYDNNMLCFDYNNNKILWSKAASFVTKENLVLTDSYVIYSLATSKCPAPDNYEIKIVDVKNGNIIRSLKGDKYFGFDGKLLYYYYYNQCGDEKDKLLSSFNIDNYSFNVKYVSDLNVLLFDYYNNRTSIIQKNIHKDGNHAYILKCFNNKLEETYSNNLDCIGKYCRFYEDFLIICDAYLGKEANKEYKLLCYSLPIDKSQVNSQQTISIVMLLLKFLLGKIIVFP